MSALSKGSRFVFMLFLIVNNCNILFMLTVDFKGWSCYAWNINKLLLTEVVQFCEIISNLREFADFLHFLSMNFRLHLFRFFPHKFSNLVSFEKHVLLFHLCELVGSPFIVLVRFITQIYRSTFLIGLGPQLSKILLLRFWSFQHKCGV